MLRIVLGNRKLERERDNLKCILNKRRLNGSRSRIRARSTDEKSKDPEGECINFRDAY